MGVDIHLFIEYDTNTNFKRPQCLAEFMVARNTSLFQSLAGISDKNNCLIPSKGFPYPASWKAESEYQTYILEDKDINEWDWELNENSNLNYIKFENAIKYLESGESNYLKDFTGKNSERFISNPYYFGASWLTLDEIYKCLNYSGIEINDLSWDFQFVLITMSNLENFRKENNILTRIVFYFDN